jgi:alcohol dehydrogenase/L-iditol 2-dehydrogenase
LPASRTRTYVFETSGHAPALRAAVERSAPGATAVLIGLSGAELPFTVEEVVRKQLVLRGSLIYDHPGDFAAAIADLQRAAFRPSTVIDAAFPLQAAQDAFAGARDRAGKTWIRIADED